MNVIHIFPYSARIPGGHSNAIRGFIGSQRAMGINAVGVSPQPVNGAEASAAGASLDDSNGECPLVEVNSLSDLRWEPLTRQLRIDSRGSLVNLHGLTYQFRYLLRDLRGAQVPVVFTSHGQLGFHTLWHGLRKFFFLHLVDRTPLRASGLHVLTPFAARRARWLLPEFKRPVLVQGNVVKIPELSTAPPATTRGDLGIPQDAYVLLFLGRLDVWVKGLDLLLEAFSRLPANRFQLVLVGPDWKGGRAKLEALSRRLGCQARVHFPGPAYGPKKWAFIQMADAFVAPSRREAFNIAQAEAMGAGLPVVTSTLVSLAEPLQQANAALVVPPAPEPLAHALLRLGTNEMGWREMAVRGRDWVMKNCDPGLAGERFARFYESVLAPCDRRTES